MDRPETDNKRVSKTLSYWLRHEPEAAGLQLDGEGWTKTNVILAALRSAGMCVDASMLSEVVSRSDKKRFEMSEYGSRIRARQGHSVAVEAGWEQADPPSLLYHGTVECFVEPIMREGLLPRARHHVHLSPDIETAKQVGSRRGKPVIFEVAAGALANAGGKFFLSSNGVWLVSYVPPTHLKPLESEE